MDGLAAIGATANVGRGNVNSDGIQEINAGVMKMRDDLRRRMFRVFFRVGARDQIRWNDQPQGFRTNSGTVGDDKIAETEKCFVFLPQRDVEKSVGPDDEENAIAVRIVRVAEIANGIHGIVKLRAAEIFAGFGERRNKVRMLSASEREHGEAVREGSQVLLELVRGPARWNEMNFVEIEAAVGSAGHGKVTVMNRVKGAAEQGDTARVMLCGGAMRLRDGQCASQEERRFDFLTNS